MSDTNNYKDEKKKRMLVSLDHMYEIGILLESGKEYELVIVKEKHKISN